MKAAWTKHLKDPADKEALQLAIRNSNVALDTLSKILKDKHKIPKTSAYDKPAWPYYRADIDGYNRALDEIIELLILDHKEKN